MRPIYNAVDFGKMTLRTIKVKVHSISKATLQIYLNKPDGKLLAEISLPRIEEWQVIENELSLSVDSAQELNKRKGKPLKLTGFNLNNKRYL